jgi:hypothetical protein
MQDLQGWQGYLCFIYYTYSMMTRVPLMIPGQNLGKTQNKF